MNEFLNRQGVPTYCWNCRGKLDFHQLKNAAFNPFTGDVYQELGCMNYGTCGEASYFLRRSKCAHLNAQNTLYCSDCKRYYKSVPFVQNNIVMQKPTPMPPNMLQSTAVTMMSGSIALSDIITSIDDTTTPASENHETKTTDAEPTKILRKEL